MLSLLSQTFTALFIIIVLALSAMWIDDLLTAHTGVTDDFDNAE